jgi:hypothetical protein
MITKSKIIDANIVPDKDAPTAKSTHAKSKNAQHRIIWSSNTTSHLSDDSDWKKQTDGHRAISANNITTYGMRSCGENEVLPWM